MLWLNNRTPYASVGVEPFRRPKGYGFVSCFDICYDSSRESLHFVEHVNVCLNKDDCTYNNIQSI